MTKLESALRYIRARPAIIILTACSFTFFFVVIYFSLAMIVSAAAQDLARWAAAIISAGITATIVMRHRNDA